MTSQAQVLATLTSQIPGRSRIINGSCRVAQRPPLVCSAGVFGYGGPDRFYANNGNSAGGQFTQSQNTITYGGIALDCVVQTVNTSVASLNTTHAWLGISQSIEGFNCFDLLGQQACVSFIFNTNVTGTYSVALQDYTQNNSFVTTFAATAGVPVKVTIPIASIPTSLTTPNSSAGGMRLFIGALNAGTYQCPSPNLGSWQVANYISAPAAVNWGATSGNFIAVTGLKLEAGQKATPMEPRLYSEELALCRRYAEVLSGYVLGVGAVQNSTSAYVALQYVEKRATPTLTFQGTGAFFAANVGTVTPTSFTSPLAGIDSSLILVGYSTGGLVAGQSCWLSSANGGSVLVNAEL